LLSPRERRWKRGKYGSFETGKVAAAEQQCSNSSRVTQAAAAAAIGGGGEQTVKCKHRPHWLFMIIHRERRRGCQGALRAADNFLISSPRLPFFTPSLSSKCPFAGTPGLPLMCPRDADILSSTSAENK